MRSGKGRKAEPIFEAAEGDCELIMKSSGPGVVRLFSAKLEIMLESRDVTWARIILAGFMLEHATVWQGKKASWICCQFWRPAIGRWFIRWACDLVCRCVFWWQTAADARMGAESQRTMHALAPIGTTRMEVSASKAVAVRIMMYQYTKNDRT
jgi:hypothetical protein